MANDFLRITDQALARHGSEGTYIRVSAGVYDIVTATQTNTTTEYAVQMYKKHIKANQYNYPALIGKDIALFYISASSLEFVPNIRDKISYGESTYMIDSYSEHIANGEVVLYKILALKG